MGTIRKPKLSDAVIDVIKNKIITGEFKKGDRLPNQNDFAKQLGVSRTALREAFDSLTKSGVLEQRQKTGTIIKTNYPPLEKETQSLPFLNDRRAAIEMIETRLLIEEGAAKLAAQNATEEQIGELEKVFNEMTKALAESNMHEYSKKDADFHALTVQATQNRVTIHIYNTLQEINEKFLLDILNVYNLSVLLRNSLDFHESHKIIYHAIKNRQPEAAGKEMKRHLLTVLDSLKQYYKHWDKVKKRTQTPDLETASSQDTDK